MLLQSCPPLSFTPWLFFSRFPPILFSPPFFFDGLPFPTVLINFFFPPEGPCVCPPEPGPPFTLSPIPLWQLRRVCGVASRSSSLFSFLGPLSWIWATHQYFFPSPVFKGSVKFLSCLHEGSRGHRRDCRLLKPWLKLNFLAGLFLLFSPFAHFVHSPHMEPPCLTPATYVPPHTTLSILPLRPLSGGLSLSRAAVSLTSLRFSLHRPTNVTEFFSISFSPLPGTSGLVSHGLGRPPPRKMPPSEPHFSPSGTFRLRTASRPYEFFSFYVSNSTLAIKFRRLFPPPGLFWWPVLPARSPISLVPLSSSRPFPGVMIAHRGPFQDPLTVQRNGTFEGADFLRPGEICLLVPPLLVPLADIVCLDCRTPYTFNLPDPFF